MNVIFTIMPIALMVAILFVFYRIDHRKEVLAGHESKGQAISKSLKTIGILLSFIAAKLVLLALLVMFVTAAGYLSLQAINIRPLF